MSGVVQDSIKREQGFLSSLFRALVGVGFIAMAVYFGARDDFLAKLFIRGGDSLQYAGGVGIALLFIGGVVLVGMHLLNEEESRDYYEQTPY